MSRDKHRYEHVYWDSHNRLRHRIIWPRYRFPVYYSCGPRFTFRYVYPFYLRRYIFVSLGGYWPMDYCYLRYYWYGCHPYWWYGYYPVAREVTGDTYNYYTYNYYYSDGAASTEYSQAADAIMPVDHNTFADVREKLAQQAANEPAAETAADVQFDEAVKAFEAGDYETAVENFSEAEKLAPDDMVLPFAYSQALFANEQYAEAAEVLRTALAKVSPEKEGVFYPRGLYSDDEILFEQIEHLKQKAESYSFDADLQLLFGYQLLGIGEVDKAVEPLQQASLDLENAEAATVLLNLIEKIKTNTETENAVQ
jgi:tetratricopeptide (TPR) repeat protein